MLIPKQPPPIRDKAYLEWLCELGCCECGTNPVQAHHLLCAPDKCMGRRGGDNWCIPVCHEHHTAIHRKGSDRRYRDLARALWECYRTDCDSEDAEEIMRACRVDDDPRTGVFDHALRRMD